MSFINHTQRCCGCGYDFIAMLALVLLCFGLFFAFVLWPPPLPLPFAIAIAFAFTFSGFGSVFVALYTRSGVRCLRFKSIRKQIKTFQDLYAQLSKSARVRLSAQGNPPCPFLPYPTHPRLAKTALPLTCPPSPPWVHPCIRNRKALPAFNLGTLCAGTKRAQQSQHTLH